MGHESTGLGDRARSSKFCTSRLCPAILCVSEGSGGRAPSSKFCRSRLCPAILPASHRVIEHGQRLRHHRALARN